MSDSRIPREGLHLGFPVVIATLVSAACIAGVFYADDRHGNWKLSVGSANAVAILVSAWVGIITLFALWHAITLASSDRHDRSVGTRLLVLTELDWNLAPIVELYENAFRKYSSDAGYANEDYLFTEFDRSGILPITEIELETWDSLAYTQLFTQLPSAFTAKQVKTLLSITRNFNALDTEIRELQRLWNSTNPDAAFLPTLNRIYSIARAIVSERANLPKLEG